MLAVMSIVLGVLAAGALTSAPLFAGAPAGKEGLAWRLESVDEPVMLWAGMDHTLSVTVVNAGTRTWSEASGDHVSYHWKRLDGAVVNFEGRRAGFASPVRPGERAEVKIQVHTPPAAGRFAIEWDMVREQVAWFGPPMGGTARRTVLVLKLAAVLQIAFAGISIVLVVVVRRRRVASPAWLLACGPVIWTWLAAWLQVVTHAEASAMQLLPGGGVLVAAGAALPALVVALVPPERRCWPAAGVTLVLSGVLLADLVYLRFFGTVIPLVAAGAAFQVSEIGGSIASLLRSGDWWLLPAVLVAGLGAAMWPRPSAPASPPRRGVLWAATVALAAVSSLPALVTLKRALADPVTSDQVFTQETLLRRWGAINVHVFDTSRPLREWWTTRRVSADEQHELAAWLAVRHQPPARELPQFGMARGLNVILLQVESLQQWVVDAKVGDQAVMPYLASARGRSLVFSQIWDQTGQGRSSDGEFITLNSQHALDRGAVAFRRSENHFVALPEVLRRAGYHTASFHGFHGAFWNRKTLHPRWGIEQRFFRAELGPGETIGWGLADGPFLERVAEHLVAMPRPWFAFCITLGLHHPFDLFPDRHKVMDVGELAGTPLGNYLHAMHYFDGQLAAFMGALERAGLASTTMIALYGDHEAGLAIDGPLLALAQVAQPSVATEVMLRRVPFVVMLPGALLSGEVPVPGGQIDVAPTLLALLGIEAPATLVGRPLAPGREALVALNDGSVVGSDVVFVARGGGVPPEGACRSLPGFERMPMDSCAALAVRGREELERSRVIVLSDAAADLAGWRRP